MNNGGLILFKFLCNLLLFNDGYNLDFMWNDFDNVGYMIGLFLFVCVEMFNVGDKIGIFE